MTNEAPTTSGEVFQEAGQAFVEAMDKLGEACVLAGVGFGLALRDQYANVRWAKMKFKGWRAHQAHKLYLHRHALTNRMLMAAGWGFGIAQVPMFAMVARAHGL